MWSTAYEVKGRQPAGRLTTYEVYEEMLPHADPFSNVMDSVNHVLCRAFYRQEELID